MPRPLGRLATEALRVPGRTVPVPGWFPLVVERVHPHIRPVGARARCSVNGMLMDLDLDEYVQRRIHYHCHEVPELRWVSSFLRPGDRVLDIGANVGLFTLVAAGRVGPSGRVHALEPVPANAAALERNIALNPGTPVVVDRVAAGAAEGIISLGLDSGNGRQPVSGDYAEGGVGARIDVPVTSVDALLAGTAPLRLVKMDVEGGEPRVMAGMARTLREAPPDALLVEVNPSALHRQGFGPGDVLGPLTAAGYRMHGLTARGGLTGFRRPAETPAGRSTEARSTLGAIIDGMRGVDRVESVVALRR